MNCTKDKGTKEYLFKRGQVMKRFLRKDSISFVVLMLVAFLLYSCREQKKLEPGATMLKSSQSDGQRKAVDTDAEPPKLGATKVKVAKAEEPKVERDKELGTEAEKEPSGQLEMGNHNVLAEIGDYRITRANLKKRMLKKLQNHSLSEVPDAKRMLKKMVIEKAMIMEGRKENYLEGNFGIERTNNTELIRLMLKNELEDKIQITQEEIEKKLKKHPKLDERQAAMALQQEKGRKLTEQFYQKVNEKRKEI